MNFKLHHCYRHGGQLYNIGVEYGRWLQRCQQKPWFLATTPLQYTWWFALQSCHRARRAAIVLMIAQRMALQHGGLHCRCRPPFLLHNHPHWVLEMVVSEGRQKKHYSVKNIKIDRDKHDNGVLTMRKISKINRNNRKRKRITQYVIVLFKTKVTTRKMAAQASTYKLVTSPVI